jgi:hypothetical protein
MLDRADFFFASSSAFFLASASSLFSLSSCFRDHSTTSDMSYIDRTLIVEDNPEG